METTALEELSNVEGQIQEAISLHQQGGYEAIHLQSVLRAGLVHCQLLRRRINELPEDEEDHDSMSHEDHVEFMKWWLSGEMEE